MKPAPLPPARDWRGLIGGLLLAATIAVCIAWSLFK